MAKMKIAPEDRSRVKLACLRMLVGLKLNPAQTQLISGFVDTYLQLNQAEQQAFQNEVAQVNPPQEKEKVMQIVTSWMRDGIKQGRREMLLEMLTYRTGQLEPEVENRVRELPEDKLDKLAKALFDFSSQTDLTSWLEQPNNN